jgi:hypothetical protein
MIFIFFISFVYLNNKFTYLSILHPVQQTMAHAYHLYKFPLYEEHPDIFFTGAAEGINGLVVRPQQRVSLEERNRQGGVLKTNIMRVISLLRESPLRTLDELEELARLAEYLDTRFMLEIVARWKADTEEEKPAEDAVAELPKADTE